jgi:ATP-dependent Clp protease adaptor protein ClpS
MPDPRDKQDQGMALEEARPELRRPPLFRVVMLNDDFTPMEFVVQVLEKFFGLDRTRATRIMLEVHTRGAACAAYSLMMSRRPGSSRLPIMPATISTR